MCLRTHHPGLRCVLCILWLQSLLVPPAAHDDVVEVQFLSLLWCDLCNVNLFVHLLCSHWFRFLLHTFLELICIEAFIVVDVWLQESLLCSYFLRILACCRCNLLSALELYCHCVDPYLWLLCLLSWFPWSCSCLLLCGFFPTFACATFMYLVIQWPACSGWSADRCWWSTQSHRSVGSRC